MLLLIVERKYDVYVHSTVCIHDDVLDDAKEYLLLTLMVRQFLCAWDTVIHSQP